MQNRGFPKGVNTNYKTNNRYNKRSMKTKIMSLNYNTTSYLEKKFNHKTYNKNGYYVVCTYLKIFMTCKRLRIFAESFTAKCYKIFSSFENLV